MKTFDVISPMTGQKVSSFPQMDTNEVDALIDKARNKFETWSTTPAKERAKILARAAEVLAENALDYAARISAENGKTQFEALLADVYSACDVTHYYSQNAEKMLAPVKVKGNPMMPGRKLYYVFEPKGVVAVISPWNYPFCLSVGPVVSAIAAGNTVVLKPSSQTTDCGIIVREFLEKAGLPEGVVNIATGNGSVTGQALIENPKIDMFFFTGSTEIGKKVNIKAAERLVPTIMELGGKDTAIVTKNADLDRAAHTIAWGAFSNCGQTCIGMEIRLVERPVYNQFLEKLLAIVKNLKSGTATGCVGSMTMASQYKIVESQVADARAKGAKLLPDDVLNCKLDGMCFPPIVLTDITLDMKLMKEETFGPLLPVIPYDNIDEAIKITNSTTFGLSGAVFTNDLEEGRKIAARIKTGSVNINDALVTFAVPALPFGGVKESGVGCYHSDIGLRAFTDIKSITESKSNSRKEFYHYPVLEGSLQGMADALKLMYAQSPSQKFKAFFKVLPFMQSMQKDGKK
ncbi:MAG: aldehyde dehydrogenase family protein [Dehalococcoidia bacterium]|nr:aldehyde dehydrogenase family protein [Dehalococcoidia bacterium]